MLILIPAYEPGGRLEPVVAALLAAINISASDVRTPLMFEYQLMERARADRQRIVLPESEDDRILEAAAILNDAARDEFHLLEVSVRSGRL